MLKADVKKFSHEMNKKLLICFHVVYRNQRSPSVINKTNKSCDWSKHNEISAEQIKWSVLFSTLEPANYAVSRYVSIQDGGVFITFSRSDSLFGCFANPSPCFASSYDASRPSRLSWNAHPNVARLGTRI